MTGYRRAWWKLVLPAAVPLLLPLLLGLSPERACAQNAVSTGTRAGFRMYYPNSNDWWLDPSSGRFDIRANGGAPALSLNGQGYLGIGTTSPSFKLDIFNTGAFDGIRVWNNGSNASAGLFFQNTSAITQIGAGVGAAGSVFGIYDQVGATTRFLINSIGNVGIGTASPNALLHVNQGSIQVSPNLGPIIFGSDGVETGYFELVAGGVQLRSNLFLGLNTGGTERLRILSGGNIGIGTSNPQGKLDMNNGTIVNVATPVNNTDAANKAYVLAQAGGGGKPYMQTFTSNGTWTWPGAAVTMVWVTICGGGGGGGGAYYGGGGGGGAGYSYIHYPVQVSANVPVTVGIQDATHGAGGPYYYSDGYDGNPSSFGSLATPGGKGGTSSYSSGGYSGGNGGSGSQGGGGGGCYRGGQSTCYSGNPGIGGNGAQSGTLGNGGSAGVPNGGLGGAGDTNYGGGGGGGGSPLGIGGNGGVAFTNGANGTSNCSGGGGGGAYNRVGGNGSPGVVIVEWWQ